MKQPPGEVTQLLCRLREGDPAAASALIPLVHDELHRLAAAYMRRERSDHTLQPTALVHEAYVRLLGGNQTGWMDRAHFMAVAATIMRRILVDYARAHATAKRGGGQHRIELDWVDPPALDAQSAELIDLDEALTKLQEFDERLSRVVELRYFSGLSLDETAEVLDVSRKTVQRDWSIAKAWLRAAMDKE